MPEDTTRALPDRICHTLLYEAVGLLLVTPLASWALDHPALDTGLLALWLSLIAMLWNLVFNWGFDHLELRVGGHLSRRGWPTRIAHAVGFEGGLALLTIPLVAYWLSIGWWPAFWVDAGLMLFYLLYSVLFNWCYDKIFPLASKANNQ